MAQKRMFCKSITSSDAFTEMSLSAQALYFHLGLAADVSGFVTPKGTMRLINANTDDLRTLIAKQFVIPFESGVVVITHWNINNNIRENREAKTIYQKELKQLKENTEGEYLLLENSGSTPAEISRVEMRRDEKSKDIPFAPAKEGAELQKRKEIHFLKEDFDFIVSKYADLKGIAPRGNEWLPIQQTVKTMLLSGRTKDEIVSCMEWLAGKSEEWMENWTIRTAKIKMPEYIAQKGKHKTLREY
jgi:hypothetical protein